MVEDYEKFKIKEYKHWILFLHKNQYPYIGRCYAWAKREDANLITDMSREEQEELFNIIIPQWDKAIKKLFNHDRPNLSILGNTSPHLHAHLIPRYHNPVTHYKIEFIDPNPNSNYSPYSKKEIGLEI